jgi:hypothetical protein
MIDYLLAFLFVAAFVSLVVAFTVVCRKWPKLGVITIALYGLSYLPLTLSGDCAVANHGGETGGLSGVQSFS